METDLQTVFAVGEDQSELDSVVAGLELAGVPCRVYPDPTGLLSDVGPEVRGCVVSELRMRGADGLELHRGLLARDIRMPLILLSGSSQVSVAVEAIKQGVEDLLPKPVDSEALVQRVQECFRLDRQRAAHRKRIQGYRERLGALTDREVEVLRLVTDGMSSRWIGDRLRISRRTVDVHRSNILEKTGFRNPAELMRAVVLLERDLLAAEQGLAPAWGSPWAAPERPPASSTRPAMSGPSARTIRRPDHRPPEAS